jgi:hypothetical protein
MSLSVMAGILCFAKSDFCKQRTFFVIHGMESRQGYEKKYKLWRGYGCHTTDQNEGSSRKILSESMQGRGTEI